MTCVVERATIRACRRAILPWLRRARAERRGPVRCYVIDGSRRGWLALRVAAARYGVEVVPLTFSATDVRDPDGVSTLLRTIYRDIAGFQAEALADVVYADFTRRARPAGRLARYMEKSFAEMTVSLFSGHSLWRALWLTQVTAWQARRDGAGKSVLFLQRRPWLAALQRHAARSGVTLVATPLARSARERVRKTIVADVVRRARHIVGRARHTLRHRRRRRVPTPPAPRIAVEYYGQLNLERPERYSDVFFLQQSSLVGRDLLLTFALPSDPFDAAKAAELAVHGIDAVVLDPRGAGRDCGPVTFHLPPRRRRADARALALAAPGRDPEARWLRERLGNYAAQRAYWASLFATQHVKIHVTWANCVPMQCAIADAIESVGGVSVIYQRSWAELPLPETSIAADVAFGFSPLVADMERRSGSVIRYHVTTGYLADHRFAVLHEPARVLRARLAAAGAERVLAFFDETSVDDPRWFLSHATTRESYGFLLERVLSEPWLGLVLKPKVPLTLRRRLGPVAELLDKAIATGRCHIFEGGNIHGSHPPALAALAADVAIHGHLFAATAGIEAALAGVPTLMMDGEGWPFGVLGRIPRGRVVFETWSDLWAACRDHWRRPGGVPGLGDWSPILEDVDPFRDGRAAERMGGYLHAMLDGFRAGFDREMVMAEAAERYAAKWGADKIVAVNWRGR